MGEDTIREEIRRNVPERFLEKNLAALAQSGKVDLGDFELREFDADELSFIFDERYGKWSDADLQREATDLVKKAKH